MAKRTVEKSSKNNSKNKLGDWLQSLPKSEVQPDCRDALVRFMREQCSGSGTRVNLDNLATRLPNIASFVRAVFTEIKRRAEGGRPKKAAKAKPAPVADVAAEV